MLTYCHAGMGQADMLSGLACWRAQRDWKRLPVLFAAVLSCLHICGCMCYTTTDALLC